MKVLITGGAGYIGSHIAVQLLERGEEVVIADDFRNSHESVIDRIEAITSKRPRVYKLDVSDRSAIRQLFRDNQLDSVIHTAGLKALSESLEKPLDYYVNNLTSTFALVEAMLDFGVLNFIFSSSASVYGYPKVLPIGEDSPYACTNPYARTKMIIELFLSDIAQAREGFSLVSLRYFNPIGAHPSGLIGDDQKAPASSLMSAILKVLAGEQAHLQVFGKDYPTIDGTGVRDYIHIQDLAAGHLAALDYLRKGGIPAFETINLGTGQGYSILQLVKEVEKWSGSRIPLDFVDRRPGDVASCYADVNKAKEVLDWQTLYDLPEMCRDSLNWMRMKESSPEWADEEVKSQ